MILLDTNIVSEFMRPAPAPEVLAWLDAQAAESVFVSAITRAEIELGLALMPDGQQKQGLKVAAAFMFFGRFLRALLTLRRRCCDLLCNDFSDTYPPWAAKPNFGLTAVRIS